MKVAKHFHPPETQFDAILWKIFEVKIYGGSLLYIELGLDSGNIRQVLHLR